MEKINEKYYLGSNKNTFILYEKKVSATTGKETFKTVGYYVKLDILYDALIEKEIKEDLTLLNNIAEINQLIKDLKTFTAKYLETIKK